MSDTPMIYRQLSLVMGDIGSVSKDRRNEQQKYAFRGIEDMYLAAHPAMVKHGVLCAPSVLERTEYRFDKTNEYNKTTTWLHVMLKVEHRFFAADGSFLSVITCGEGLDNSDKATNKAMSGAMKYALIELFCVPTEDVEDSDRTTPENGRKPASTVPVTQAPIPLPPKPPTKATAPAVSETEMHANHAVPEMIGVSHKKAFARAWKDALPVSLQSMSEQLRGDWMKRNGYVDATGKPTSGAIPLFEFEHVKAAACAFAHGLADAPIEPKEN